MKERIEATRRGQSGTTEALDYRQELAAARRVPDGYDPRDPYGDTSPAVLVGDAIEARAEAIERERGYVAARAFADVALGRATPVSPCMSSSGYPRAP